ncbi:MAG TPA: magnesium/cobalt transporter CorA [Usitatibacter sp.]|nr:magnesium/cobalt transporter CorA [Usitatibacter sp.]
MLINCVAYRDGKRVAEIRKEEISDYLKQSGTFVWVAMKDPEAIELEEMEQEFDLHPLAVEDARHGHQRPKIEEYGNQVFAVLRTMEIRADELHCGEVNLFVGPNFVLSIRRDTEPGFAAVRERAENEPELLQRGSGFVFYALIDNIVDRYFPLVDALEVELEKIEDHIFEGEAGEKAHANMRALYQLKHKGMTVRHAVEPLIEGIHKLYGGRVPQPCATTQEYFRDVYDHLLRISTQLDGLRDMFNTAMQVNISMISLSENAVTKRLAAYGALLAVPTMLVGVWGMNFKHMPELDWEIGYPLSIALMVVIDVVLWVRFRRIGWL